MTENDQAHITEALDHLNILEQHLLRASFTSPLVVDAVSFRLSAAIESLSKTSAEFRRQQFGENWHVMWAVRNRITHAYAHIDVDVIKLTIEHHVPQLKANLLESTPRD